MSPPVPLEEFVLNAIRSACGTDAHAVSLDTPVLDLGLDSLKMISVIRAVEATFGTRFTVEDVIGFFMAERVSDMLASMKTRLERA